MKTKDELPACPVATAVSLIGGKWKLLILRNLKARPWRFNELLRDLDGISQKVLTDSLRQMIDDGLTYRHDYRELPPKVEYVLTPSGEQLIPALDILYIWSIRQMHDRRIPIDADAFVVHKSEKYVDALGDIMRENNFWPGRERRRGVEQGEE